MPSAGIVPSLDELKDSPARLGLRVEAVAVEEFAFEEDTTGADHTKYLWSNSAYAMAVNINSAFKDDGWCVRIRGLRRVPCGPWGAATATESTARSGPCFNTSYLVVG